MSNEKKIPLLTAGLATIARHAHSLQGDKNLLEALDAIILGHAETVPVAGGRQPTPRQQTAIEGVAAGVAVAPTADDVMAQWRGAPEYLRVRDELESVASFASEADPQSAMMLVEALVRAVLERTPVAPAESGWFIPDSALTEVQRVELEDAIRSAPNATDVRLLLLFSQGGMRRDIPWLRHLRRAECASPLQQPADAAQAVKGEVIGYRVRMRGSTGPWTTVYDRAPDTWELRDGEIQNIYLAPPEPTLSMNGSMRDALEGMSVSIDVSCGDHDAGHRLFGTISEVMDCPGDKHGVTLLVQGAQPNFDSEAHLPDGQTSGAAQRRQPYVPAALVDAALQAAMAHNSANPARKGFTLTADEMRAGLAAAFAAMPQQIGAQDHLDLLQSFVVRSRRIMGADSAEAAHEALKAIDRLQLRETHRNSKSSARTPFAHRCRAWRVVFREPGIPAGSWTDGEPPEHMYERARKHDFTIQAAFDMRPEPGSAPGWFWVPLNPGADALLPLDRFMRPSAAQELWEILLAGMPQPPVAASPDIPTSKPLDGGRQPTGAMQLPEDRPGVYIRGEDAAAFAQALRLQLEDGADGGIHPIYSLECLHRLIALLDSVARADR